MPALGDTKEREGGQGGEEEEGLAKKDREETEKRASAEDSEACELYINPVGPDSSQQAPFRCSRKTSHRTMETQRNGPAMLQASRYASQRLYWDRKSALICADRLQKFVFWKLHGKQSLLTI